MMHDFSPDSGHMFLSSGLIMRDLTFIPAFNIYIFVKKLKEAIRSMQCILMSTQC